MPVHNTVVKTLYSSQAITSTPSASVAVSVRGYSEGVILVRSTAIGGTSPGVDLDVEVSDDEVAAQWYKEGDISTFTPAVAATNHTAHKVTNMGQWLRINNPGGINGSSTPTLTIVAVIVLKT